MLSTPSPAPREGLEGSFDEAMVMGAAGEGKASDEIVMGGDPSITTARSDKKPRGGSPRGGSRHQPPPEGVRLITCVCLEKCRTCPHKPWAERGER